MVAVLSISKDESERLQLLTPFNLLGNTINGAKLLIKALVNVQPIIFLWLDHGYVLEDI